MAKGFSGPPGGNMQALMQQAQQLQKQIAQAQQSAAGLRADGSSGGGAVRVVATGKNRIESIQLKPEAVNPKDVAFLQDLVRDAVNEALEAVQAKVEAEMSKATGGMSIPGLG